MTLSSGSSPSPPIAQVTNRAIRRGHALRQFFNSIAAGFETLEMNPDQIFPLGNEAAVKWPARGKGRNGRTVTFEGIDVFVVNQAGMIQSVKGYWNPAAMMAELMG